MVDGVSQCHMMRLMGRKYVALLRGHFSIEIQKLIVKCPYLTFLTIFSKATVSFQTIFIVVDNVKASNFMVFGVFGCHNKSYIV